MKKYPLQRCLALSALVLLLLSSPGYAQQAPAAEQQQRDTDNKSFNKTTTTTDTTKAYASVNGLKLYYEMVGTGEPVIVLHGGFGNTELFMPQVAELSRNHTLIYVDLQGHGRTADIDRPLVADSMANDLAALIRQLHLGKTSVIGYSLGGMVAIRLAIQHPQLLHKVVIISSPFKRKGWFPDLLAQQDQMGAASAEALKQSPLYESYVKLAPRPGDWSKFVSKMSAFIQRDYDWSKEVAAIRLPVLLIAADADGVMPEHMVQFYQLLGGGLKDAGWDGSGRPASQLAIVPGYTHYDLFTSPVLPAIIKPFLNK